MLQFFIMQSPRLAGFTLIEVLVVIGMIAILSSAVLVAVNPVRQFAVARNTERQANVAAVLNAIGERIADNRGIFTASSTCSIDLPSSTTPMKKSDGYDIRPCLVPTYLSELPNDPVLGESTCTSDECDKTNETYDSGYTIRQDEHGRVTVCAPGAKESVLKDSEEYCLTR